MVADADVNAIVEDQRRGVSDLAVNVVGTAAGDLRHGRRLPDECARFRVQREKMSIAEMQAGRTVGCAEDYGFGASDFRERGGGGDAPARGITGERRLERLASA